MPLNEADTCRRYVVPQLRAASSWPVTRRESDSYIFEIDGLVAPSPTGTVFVVILAF